MGGGDFYRRFVSCDTNSDTKDTIILFSLIFEKKRFYFCFFPISWFGTRARDDVTTTTSTSLFTCTPGSTFFAFSPSQHLAQPSQLEHALNAFEKVNGFTQKVPN